MAKIEVEVPDNILEFMKAYQEWEGSDINPAAYALKAIKSSCEADLDDMLGSAPKKAKKIVHDLQLGSIVMSPHCYPAADLKGG